MWVRPKKLPPAAFKLATAGQSAAAAGCPFKTVDPAKVALPATSKRSLTEKAKPFSGEFNRLGWFRGSSPLAGESMKKAFWQP
jgi:hypothetical protein